MSKTLFLVENFCCTGDAHPHIMAACLNLKTRYLDLKDIKIVPNENDYPHGITKEIKCYGLKIMVHSYRKSEVTEYQLSIAYVNVVPDTKKIFVPPSIIC